MSILVANGLTHWFGHEVALESVDLAIDAGEHMAVLGENGAGKTTLLRILATAARPTSGRLQIMGLDALKERRRLRQRIGYVAHSPGLYPALYTSVLTATTSTALARRAGAEIEALLPNIHTPLELRGPNA